MMNEILRIYSKKRNEQKLNKNTRMVIIAQLRFVLKKLFGSLNMNQKEW